MHLRLGELRNGGRRHLPAQAAEVGPDRRGEELVHGVRVREAAAEPALVAPLVAALAADAAQLAAPLERPRRVRGRGGVVLAKPLTLTV